MKKTTTVASLLATLAASSVSGAFENDNFFRGSDTLENPTNILIDLCGRHPTFGPQLNAFGELNYGAEGSSNGENAMRDGDQRMGPMSRFLDDTGCSQGNGELAAGLVLALDALVMVGGARATEPGDNDDVSAPPNNGDLGSSLAFNRTQSGYTFQSAVDVLAVMFGGVSNNGTRNCNSAIRNTLQDNYTLMTQAAGGNVAEQGAAANCGTFWRRNDANRQYLYSNNGSTVAPVPSLNATKLMTAQGTYSPAGNGTGTYALTGQNGVLQTQAGPAGAIQISEVLSLLRRGDFSGTTGVFIELVGLPGTTFSSLNDAPLTSGFCNGTELESNDPIKVQCTPEMDVCDNDGQKGLLVPIVVPGERAPGTLGPDDPGLTVAQVYPTVTCNSGSFAYAPNPINPVNSSQFQGCPDGGLEFLGSCETPLAPGGGFNCLNLAANTTLFGSGDGRAFNKIVRYANGTVIKDGNSFEVYNAWYRMLSRNEADAAQYPGLPSATERDCLEDDATRQIGCFAGALDCTAGFAGNEASEQPNAIPHALANVDPDAPLVAAFQYALSRKLYFNTIQGFAAAAASVGSFPENALLSCVLAGTTAGQVGGVTGYPSNTRLTTIAALESGYFPFLDNPATPGVDESAAQCQDFTAADARGACTSATNGCAGFTPL